MKIHLSMLNPHRTVGWIHNFENFTQVLGSTGVGDRYCIETGTRVPITSTIAARHYAGRQYSITFAAAFCCFVIRLFSWCCAANGINPWQIDQLPNICLLFLPIILSEYLYIHTEIIFNLPSRIIIYKHRYLLRIEITYTCTCSNALKLY